MRGGVIIPEARAFLVLCSRISPVTSLSLQYVRRAGFSGRQCSCCGSHVETVVVFLSLSPHLGISTSLDVDFSPSLISIPDCNFM